MHCTAGVLQLYCSRTASGREQGEVPRSAGEPWDTAAGGRQAQAGQDSRAGGSGGEREDLKAIDMKGQVHGAVAVQCSAVQCSVQ